jgi:hypothetical protein
MTPTTQLNLVPRLRNSGTNSTPSTRLHDVEREKLYFFKHPINHMEELSMTTNIFHRDEHREKGIYTVGSGLSPILTAASHWSQQSCTAAFMLEYTR